MKYHVYEVNSVESREIAAFYNECEAVEYAKFLFGREEPCDAESEYEQHPYAEVQVIYMPDEDPDTWKTVYQSPYFWK